MIPEFLTWRLYNPISLLTWVPQISIIFSDIPFCYQACISVHIKNITECFIGFKKSLITSAVKLNKDLYKIHLQFEGKSLFLKIFISS